MKKLILVLIGLMSLNSFATHIVGGEMIYKKLSGNDYQIDLVLYRDCFNGVPPFDNPAIITVFNANGTVLLTQQLILLKDTLVPFTGNVTNCPADTTSSCIKKGFYSDTLNLPPLVGGYTIVYQRCCRAASILDVVNSGEIGVTYWTHIPGSDIVPSNNSPLFTINPPFYAYTNTLNVLDQSATDSDGDSLAYFFTNVFIGADACCPAIGLSGCTPTCPTAAGPPPYTSVTYNTSYSAAQPVHSSTPLSIHSTTGMISLTPTTIGNYAIGLGIKEYRNHNLIGTYYRDFHMKVIPCGTTSVTPTGPSTVTPTGTEEISGTDFQIFPNPADKVVTINLSTAFEDAYYTLTDISGRIILRRKIERASESFNVTELSKGLYFLRIESRDRKMGIHKKLLIE